MQAKQTASASQTVAKRLFSDQELREIGGFDDFAKLIQSRDVQVIDAAKVIGDGFSLTDNKRSLIDVPFLIVDYRFSKSDKFKDENGEPLEFVTVRLVTRNDQKLIINDGSTGIRDQLKQINGGESSVVYVGRGLRVSEYTYTDDKGRQSEAETFYLSV